MVRRLLPPIVTVTTTLAVMAGTLFAVGAWRRSGDRRWCDDAVMAGSVLRDPQLLSGGLVAQQRSACAVQRQRQRVMFGAIWRNGGTVMAQCGFELARLQLVSHSPAARRAILEPYGLDDPGFTGSGLDQQDRFIKACLAEARHQGG